MMNKKNLPHIITVLLFAVFVVLGLSSLASTPSPWEDVVYSGEDSQLLEGTAWTFRLVDRTERRSEMVFLADGKILKDSRYSWGEGDASWERNGQEVKVVYSNGQSHIEGRLNQDNNRITGTYSNYTGDSFNLVMHLIGPAAFESNPRNFRLLANHLTNTIEVQAYLGNSTQVRIPASVREPSSRSNYHVTIIGTRSFSKRGLTDIRIPDGVIRIEAVAFTETRLTSVVIPDTVTFIGDGAFLTSQLASVKLSNNLSNIGVAVFSNNQITDLTIPASVRTIGERAFRNNKLTSITIPNGVTSIGENAFADNMLTSISLPDSLTQLAANAFSGSNNLITRITIGPNVNITGTELMSFNFKTAYLANSLRGGTYTFTNGQWVGEFR